MKRELRILVFLSLILVLSLTFACAESIPKTCTDSDGGIYQEKFGVVFAPNANMGGVNDSCLLINGAKSSIVKSCSGENCYLIEFYCFSDGIYMGSKKIICQNGCLEGVCAKEEIQVNPNPEAEANPENSANQEIQPIQTTQTIQTCKDSDEGINYNIKGDIEVSVGSGTQIFIDYCDDSVILNESYCEENIPKTITHDCWVENKVCLNGACVLEPGKCIINADCKTGYECSSGGDCVLVQEIFPCGLGCSLDGRCYAFGNRKSGEYCSSDHLFVNQVENNNFCGSNFECKSNLCSNNKCMSKPFSFFMDLFRRR